MPVFSFHRVILVAGLIVAAGLPMAASAQIFFNTTLESRLWLEGSSTVHQFDCVARSIQGTAYYDDNRSAGESTVTGNLHNSPENANSQENANSRQYIAMSDHSMGSGNSPRTGTGQDSEETIDQSDLYVYLMIPIKSFDCGRSRMNRDMYEALKSDQHEFITFEFKHAREVDNAQPDADSLFENGFKPYTIEGILNVAGIGRPVTLIVRGRPEAQGRYRIKGHKEISMKDFEIEPPTALRGLIRAHDELTVYFDLIVIEESS